MACKALLEIMEPEIDEIKKKAMKEARVKGLEEGRAEGRVKGLAEGIKIVIETYREMLLPREKAKDLIMEKFSLSAEEAGSYMEKYW